MNWRKNAVSYILWIVYLAAAVGGLFYVGSFLAPGLGLATRDQFLAGAVCAAAVIVLFCVCRVLRGGIAGEYKNDRNENHTETGKSVQTARSLQDDAGKSGDIMSRVLIPVTLLAVFLVAGLLFRVERIPAEEFSLYYETARTDGGALPQITQGAVYLYLQLLRTLFGLTGNLWVAGIYLQIFLQMLACILLSLTVWRMSGAAAGLWTAAFLMFSPTEIGKALTYSPEMLYRVLFAMGLFFATCYLTQLRHRGQSARVWVMLPVLGALLGFLCYLDISGVAIPVMLLSALWLVREKREEPGRQEGLEEKKGKKEQEVQKEQPEQKKQEKQKDQETQKGQEAQKEQEKPEKQEKHRTQERVWDRASLQLLILLGCTVVWFLLFLGIDAFLSGKKWSGVFSAWLQLYQWKGLDGTFWFAEAMCGEAIILLVMLLLGALGYLVYRDRERTSPWVLLCLSLFLMGFFRLPTEDMGISGLIWVAAIMLSGVGIGDWFRRVDPVPEKREIEEKQDSEEQKVAEEQRIVEEERVTEEKQDAKENSVGAGDKEGQQPEAMLNTDDKTDVNDKANADDKMEIAEQMEAAEKTEIAEKVEIEENIEKTEDAEDEEFDFDDWPEEFLSSPKRRRAGRRSR